MDPIDTRFLWTEFREEPPTLNEPARKTSTSTNHYTADEQRILDFVAELRGHEYAYRHASLILNQARMMGEL